ncbi:MAG: peptidoglycan DD-metalloendopeptidase family protein [Bacteroidota bacterium]|nr:peptidoglycan DD-metalloendopeptidase family protein [Bacteroidota bacterium]
MEEKQIKRKILKRLKNRYRLFVINEVNFQEKASISLTPFNVLLIASAGLLLFSLISWGIFTLFPGVKNYSPGYSEGFDGKMKNEVFNKLSKLESELYINQKRELALKQIINGNEITAFDIPYKSEKSRKVELAINETKADGSRVQDADQKIKKAQKEESKENIQKPSNENIEFEQMTEIPTRNYLFFSPVKGQITKDFNARTSTTIEIMPNSDESVKAVMDGTIVFKGWTPQFGYVTSIQHSNNWLSTYKFNISLFKEVGDFVSSGETIGMIGYILQKGETKKLGFELWKNGIAVNPKNFIVF